MVDASTVCSVLCLLGLFSAVAGITGYSQGVWVTCSRRIDYHIEIQVLMISMLFSGAMGLLVYPIPINVNISNELELVFLVSASVSVSSVAGSALIQFIMLIGLNNHCDNRISSDGLLLLWIYEVMNMLFAAPILIYFGVMFLAIGPLLYFDWKRKRSSDIILERAQDYFGYPEGWQAFRQTLLPAHLYKSHNVLVLYTIHHCSWEITSGEQVRCAELGMVCPVCEDPYLAKELVFVDPNTFRHAHAACLDSDREALKTPQQHQSLYYFRVLATKVLEVYGLEYNPKSMMRFFEEGGLFRLSTPKLKSAQNPPKDLILEVDEDEVDS